MELGLSIFALIIATLSFLFTWARWQKDSREQRLRLRPYIAIDNPQPTLNEDHIDVSPIIQNVGLVPAKKVKTKILLATEPVTDDLDLGDSPKYSVFPGQKIASDYYLIIAKQSVQNGSKQLFMFVKVEYEFEGHTFHCKEWYQYEHAHNIWAIKDSDFS
jgi:hypothetical protein